MSEGKSIPIITFLPKRTYRLRRQPFNTISLSVHQDPLFKKIQIRFNGLISFNDQVSVYNMWEASVYDYNAARPNVYYFHSKAFAIYTVYVDSTEKLVNSVKTIFFNSKSMYLKKGF